MKRNKWFGLLSAASICVSIFACGGSNSSSTAPTSLPLPAAPVTAVVTQGSFGGLLASSGVSTPPFTTTAMGKLDVSVDWTFAKNDVDIYVVRGAAGCSAAQFNARQCEFVALSESSTAKPEKISVPSLAAGPYTLLIINWGPDSESISYQALLTTGGTAAAATRPTSVESTKAGTLEHVVR